MSKETYTVDFQVLTNILLELRMGVSPSMGRQENTVQMPPVHHSTNIP